MSCPVYLKFSLQRHRHRKPKHRQQRKKKKRLGLKDHIQYGGRLFLLLLFPTVDDLSTILWVMNLWLRVEIFLSLRQGIKCLFRPFIITLTLIEHIWKLQHLGWRYPECSALCYWLIKVFPSKQVAVTNVVKEKRRTKIIIICLVRVLTQRRNLKSSNGSQDQVCFSLFLCFCRSEFYSGLMN